MPQGRRPAAPASSLHLADGAEGGVVGQLPATFGPVAVELIRAWKGGPELLQSLHLEREGLVAVDPAAAVEVPAGPGQRLQLGRQALPSGDLFDVDVERVAK